MLEKSEHVVSFVDSNDVASEISEEELSNLGPGCYVQVIDGDNCFWAEIQAVDGDYFSGIVHCELGESVCKTDMSSVNESTFHKKQVVNLGCDNYCWC